MTPAGLESADQDGSTASARGGAGSRGRSETPLDALTRHRLKLLGLDPVAVERAALPERVRAVYGAFVARVPYETLSNLQRGREHPAQPDSWMRTTDRLLRDAATDGAGGTCFAMAYALAELFRGVGANAHTTLGHHLRKEEPHAATIVYRDDGPYLYDASYFVPDGVPVRPDGQVRDALFVHVLEPRRGPMLTFVQRVCDGSSSPLYSLIPMPAPPDAFRRAWVETCRRRMREAAVKMARRVGDEVHWYGEKAGRIEVLSPAGRRVEQPGPDLAADLHRRFGISEALLRAHFSVGAAAG